MTTDANGKVIDETGNEYRNENGEIEFVAKVNVYWKDACGWIWEVYSDGVEMINGSGDSEDDALVQGETYIVDGEYEDQAWND